MKCKICKTLPAEESEIGICNSCYPVISEYIKNLGDVGDDRNINDHINEFIFENSNIED